MKSISYGWIEAAVRYTGRFGPREKVTYRDIFQISAASVSRHQEFVADALEQAAGANLFQKTSSGHLKGGKILLLKGAELPLTPVFARMPTLEIWLQDTFGERYLHQEGISRHQADDEIVRPIVNSLIDNKPLRMEYHAKEGIISRTISPHIIVNVVGRLHLRAFDHSKNGCRDYVLSRISQIRRIDDGSITYIGPEHDRDWATFVTVEVRENADIYSSATNGIRMDFGLEETGMKTMEVRKPLAPYLIEAEDNRFKSPVNVKLKNDQQ